MTTCPTCGGTELESISGEYYTSWSGIALVLKDIPRYGCPKCQKEFFTADQTEVLSVAVRRAVAEPKKTP